MFPVYYKTTRFVFYYYFIIFSGTVTHTRGYGNDAWWSLTYPYPVYIEELQIFGRTDCCASRIDGASVTIDGKNVATLNHNDGRPMVVPVNKAGKVIMIRNKEGGSQLSLAEVLVCPFKYYYYFILRMIIVQF